MSAKEQLRRQVSAGDHHFSSSSNSNRFQVECLNLNLVRPVAMQQAAIRLLAATKRRQGWNVALMADQFQAAQRPPPDDDGVVVELCVCVFVCLLLASVQLAVDSLCGICRHERPSV